MWMVSYVSLMALLFQWLCETLEDFTSFRQKEDSFVRLKVRLHGIKAAMLLHKQECQVHLDCPISYKIGTLPRECNKPRDRKGPNFTLSTDRMLWDHNTNPQLYAMIYNSFRS